MVKTAVASYLVWFKRRSKIDQDNIILQWMIYGHAPGGRHSATTSQHRRRECGYHMPFDGLILEDKEESIERICSHHFCSLGLQLVMNIGRWQMRTIQQTAKTHVMMPLSKSHGKPSRSEVKADDPCLAPLLAHLD